MTTKIAVGAIITNDTKKKMMSLEFNDKIVFLDMNEWHEFYKIVLEAHNAALLYDD